MYSSFFEIEMTTRNVICHLVFSICFLVTEWSNEKNITGWNLTFHHHQRHLTLLKFLTCRWIGHKIEGVSCLLNSQGMMHCLYSYLSNKLGFSDFTSYLQVEFPSFTFLTKFPPPRGFYLIFCTLSTFIPSLKFIGFTTFAPPPCLFPPPLLLERWE